MRYKNGKVTVYAVYVRDGEETPKVTAGGVEYAVKAVIVLGRKKIKRWYTLKPGDRRYVPGRVRYAAGYREKEWRRVRLRGRKVLIQRMGGSVTLHDEKPRVGLNYPWNPTNREVGPALATFRREDVAGLAELPSTTAVPPRAAAGAEKE